MRDGLRGLVGKLLAVVAVLGVAIALKAIEPEFRPPVSLLLLPIMAAAYWGRWATGMCATVAASIATAVGLIPHDAHHAWVRPCAVLLVGSLMCLAIEALHRARIDVEREKRDLAVSGDRFHTLFHASPVAMSLSRLADLEISEANAAYQSLFGVQPARLVGRTAHDLGIIMAPAQRVNLRARLARGEALRDEEVEVMTPIGARTVMLSSQIVDVAGARHVLSTFIDATARRAAEQAATGHARELLELQEQVRQSQKLESLGLLAGGVAHDFNNILAVIGASSGMLAENATAEDRDLVEELEKAVDRGSRLTRSLLAFSRHQVIAPVVLDVNQVVDETRKMLRRMVGDRVVLTSSLDPDLCNVLVDPGALAQVLMNLAVNARDAMPAGGTLRIDTRNIAGPDGTEVLLEVTDSGCGMSLEIQKRIFEPFFTTKGPGAGTGLGLSVVHGIVRQAGGRIEVSSATGQGTTFRLRFPATTALASAIDAHEADAHDTGTEQVLLVDDDRFVRSSAARALRRRGYEVLEAADGATALSLLTLFPAVALLVTDVVMPGMDGIELASIARTRRPDLQVLYTSGYVDEVTLQRDASFLEKPFHTRQLATRVRRMIDTDRRRRAS